MIAFCYQLKQEEGGMAQVLVRRLDDKVVERLKRRAKEHGRSLQSEVKTILEEAAPDYEAARKRIERFRANLKRSGRRFGDSATLIRGDRDR
jgi:plasmid stability protein